MTENSPRLMSSKNTFRKTGVLNLSLRKEKSRTVNLSVLHTWQPASGDQDGCEFTEDNWAVENLLSLDCKKMCLCIMLYSSKQSFDTLFSHNLPTTLSVRQWTGHNPPFKKRKLRSREIGWCTCTWTTRCNWRKYFSPISQGKLAFFFTTLLPCGIKITSSTPLPYSCTSFKEWMLIQISSCCAKEHQLLLHVKCSLKIQGFPGGAVVKNMPASSGDTGSSPDPGRSHMLRSN